MALFAASQNENVSRESSARGSEALRSLSKANGFSHRCTNTPRDKFQFSSSAHGALALLSHSTVPVARAFFTAADFYGPTWRQRRREWKNSFLRVVEMDDVLRMIQLKKNKQYVTCATVSDQPQTATGGGLIIDVESGETDKRTTRTKAGRHE